MSQARLVTRLRRLACAAAMLAAAHGKAKDESDVLWFQNDNANGVGIVSQNFESSFDAYDCQAADDFVVPGGEVWVVKVVEVTGTYFGANGPARSENVVFYKNRHGLPGEVVQFYSELVGADPNGWGAFVITLPEPVKLKPGRYWLSVQVNMDFLVSSEWGWALTDTARGKGAAWVNPGDGFDTGCSTYQPETVCIGPNAPDHMFTLRGKRKPGLRSDS